jgi:CRISPR-associated RAMP protein (TIGR02581 family)
MLKRIVNEARIQFDIKTTGPLLVRSGHTSVKGPDMTPVRTFRNGKPEVYIPGSSLKGVIRSHAEKIVRTLKPGVACNPFVMTRDRSAKFEDIACSDKFERRKKDLHDAINSEMAYADSCPICRLFGSLEFIGRVGINDAYLAAGQFERTELRDGVGIDRLTGGASHQAKFELEAVSSGTTFKGEALLRNFECWQLGLLLAVLLDLEDGMIQVGSGRSRGFGSVTAHIGEMTIHHLVLPTDHAADEVWGLGRFLGDGTYRTNGNDVLKLAQALTWNRHGLRHYASVSEDHLANLREVAFQELAKRIDDWRVPAEMSFKHFEQLWHGGRG